MDSQGFDVGEYVDQIRDEYRDGMVANFERIKAIAHLINSFPRSETIYDGDIFLSVSP